MASLPLLAAVVVCTVGGILSLITSLVCIFIHGSCPRIFTSIAFAVLAPGMFFGILFFIILCITCRAFLRRIKSPLSSSISMVEKFLREHAYEMPMPTRYSQSHVKKITNNFAEKLGEGGYGVVYKGELRNGTPVAVKLLDRHRHSEAQFMNEVATIGHVHHVNLVRLLGYCFENFTSALLYEYMDNGSLEKYIFAGKEKGGVLTWEQLYSIALGAARGIAYLHQDCNKRIVHFDIKPHNILLDAEFTPKVSDFGLAKLCGKGDDHISMTAGRGTPGYVAPELFHSDAGAGDCWRKKESRCAVEPFQSVVLSRLGFQSPRQWGVRDAIERRKRRN